MGQLGLWYFLEPSAWLRPCYGGGSSTSKCCTSGRGADPALLPNSLQFGRIQKQSPGQVEDDFADAHLFGFMWALLGDMSISRILPQGSPR